MAALENGWSSTQTTKMDVLPKTFLQIILTAKVSIAAFNYIPQSAGTTFVFFVWFLFYASSMCINWEEGGGGGNIHAKSQGKQYIISTAGKYYLSVVQTCLFADSKSYLPNMDKPVPCPLSNHE